MKVKNKIKSKEEKMSFIIIWVIWHQEFKMLTNKDNYHIIHHNAGWYWIKKQIRIWLITKFK